MPTTQEIQNWLAANPTADDRTIAAAMNQYGVTPAQMAQATGLGQNAVQQRYDAAMQPLTRPTPQPSAPMVQTGNAGLGSGPGLGRATLPPNAQVGGAPRTEADWETWKTMAYYPAGTDMAKAKADFMSAGAGPGNQAPATQQSPYYGNMPPANYAAPSGAGAMGSALGSALTEKAATSSTAPTTTTGSQPTSGLPAYSQVNQQQGIAQYAQPYIGSMMGATMGQLFNRDQSGNVTGLRGYTPYSYNPADYYAAFTPMQQQVFQQAGQMQTPGQFGQATQAANAGILSALGAGNRYGQMVTNPYAAAAFMSPYYQNVVDTQMQQAKRQADIAAQTQQAQAAKAGAFGGSRDLIQRQQANAELQRNLQNIQATGSQNAYQQAMQNMQNVAGLGLQGAQAGITGAGQLGQLGTAQLGAQTGILGLQSQLGAQQQKQQQDIINQGVQNYQTAQQYPYMQLGFMQNMLQGLPLTTQAQQTYQQPPSTLAQLAGAGTALAGLGQIVGGSSGIMSGLSSIGSGISSGLSSLGSMLPFKEGGKVPPSKKQAPAGLAELAISKM